MKKQKLLPSLMMMGLMMVISPSTLNVLASSSYGGGSGTESDPYLISTPEHLNQLQLDVNVNEIDTYKKYYQLTNDIDLSGYDNDSDESNGNFTPIGISSSISFKGMFDGNGKVISNVNIILPEQSYVGLFGYIDYATIQNLGLENISIQAKQYVGGITGYQSSGVIDRSYVSGNVSGSGNCVGGLVGRQNYGAINQSYVTGEVSGSDYAGGVVGYQNSGTIAQSYSTGNVSGNENVGGFVGYQGGSSNISESYSTGSVSGSYYIGGLIGYQYKGSISQSYSTGSVSGKSNYVGGLVGEQITYATIEDGYWDAKLSGQSVSDGGYPIQTEGVIGGLSYYVFNGFDFRNTWILCVDEAPQLRWQVDGCQEVERSNFPLEGDGTKESPYLISAPENLIELSKLIYHGGMYPSKSYKLTSDIDLAGYDTDEDKSNGNFIPLGSEEVAFKGGFDGDGHVISNLEVVLPEQSYVGLFGYTSSATIRRLGIENVVIEGKNYIGGLVGYQSSGTINRCYVTGNVSGSGDRVGGLVGYQGRGTIEQSYATTNVSGSYKVGGLVGSQNFGTINQSYSTGNVSGNEDVGGFVGCQGGSSNSSNISQSYSTGSVSGKKYIGGFAGYQNSGTISESYSIGSVSGGSVLAGFIARQTDATVVQNSYWDVETSGQSGSDGGIKIRTAGLMSDVAYFVLDGFDFENTWVLCEGESPKLRWQVNSCQEVQRVEFLLEGSGAKESPYLISAPEDLVFMSRLANAGVKYSSNYYQLTNDINLLGYDNDSDESNGNFVPIGSSSFPFKGTFDGNGKVISNLEIILPEQNYLGFFGYTSAGTIQELGLEDAVVEGKEYVGGLVGYQYLGTISESYATGSVIGYQYVGGLVGRQSGSSSKIDQSYVTGEVSGSDYAGGLIGYQYQGVISESYATGSVSGSSSYVGGLVGYQSSGTIGQSYATGNVSGSSSYVGGLVGYQYNGSMISQSYAAGKVGGSSSVGGLVGYKYSSATTENSYWDKQTTGQSSSKGGTGLTTEQMIKRNAQTNMVGFDFETVWRRTDGYPELRWQPKQWSWEESDVAINGTIEATILSLTIPSNSMTFALNPNEEVGKQFIASDFELINGSQTPLTLEIKSFEQVTNVLTDVEPTKYSDWTGLNKTESKDIALALVPKVGDGWLFLNEGNRWVANLGEPVVGTIKGGSTVSFGFEAKHGTSFNEPLAPQYKLTFVFGLQD